MTTSNLSPVQEETLAALRSTWERQPTLRLGQLVWQAVHDNVPETPRRCASTDAVTYIPDAALRDALLARGT